MEGEKGEGRGGEGREKLTRMILFSNRSESTTLGSLTDKLKTHVVTMVGGEKAGGFSLSC
jgi:hypothetical protein